jgi:IclR family acetate operon transcriptional repressor
LVTAGIAASGSTRTVERALGLLAEVCAEESLTLTECARRAQLPPSTALRLLRTLEASGFVERDRDGSFHSGTRVIQIGATALGRQPLVRLARPGLERIVEATGESAYLAIRGPRDTAVYIAMVEGTRAVRHTSWVGRAIPLGDLAVGRALRDEPAEHGYFAQRDRNEPDVTGIAAPVRWAGGVAGALNLVGPTYRIDETAMHSYGEAVLREAAAISERLAASPSLLRKATGS